MCRASTGDRGACITWSPWGATSNPGGRRACRQTSRHADLQNSGPFNPRTDLLHICIRMTSPQSPHLMEHGLKRHELVVHIQVWRRCSHCPEHVFLGAPETLHQRRAAHVAAVGHRQQLADALGRPSCRRRASLASATSRVRSANICSGAGSNCSLLQSASLCRRSCCKELPAT